MKRPETTPGVVCTHSGVAFDLIHPSPAHVEIEDIAHALARQCRFNGHVHKFYSVAQHSVLVANMVESATPVARQIALLHDASEAYTGDMVRPLKATMPEFREIERRVMAVIWDRFRVAANEIEEWGRAVEQADSDALDWERRDLMPPTDWWPTVGVTRPELVPVGYAEAEAMFLDAWDAARR